MAQYPLPTPRGKGLGGARSPPGTHMDDFKDDASPPLIQNKNGRQPKSQHVLLLPGLPAPHLLNVDNGRGSPGQCLDVAHPAWLTGTMAHMPNGMNSDNGPPSPTGWMPCRLCLGQATRL